MSEGYASRLSEYTNKGVCGLPERYDSKRSLTLKLKRLAELVASSRHCVVLTGAGISTSAGIPDFRGPNGIWTAEKQEKKKKKQKKTKQDNNQAKDVQEFQKYQNGTTKNNATQRSTTNRKRQRPTEETSFSSVRPLDDFSAAQPTLTHRAITKLVSLGKIKYCITQNVDGLHRRSGLSRDHHAALHGCAFTEKCKSCDTEHFRDKDVGGMSFQPTGRKCDHCDGDLHDTLLDWEDALPEDDLDRAEEECDRSDLVLCLGTSLRIEPVGSLPRRAKKFVIVNLQDTPKDSYATMVIRAPVDEVMNDLMKQLGYPDWDLNQDGDAPSVERHWKKQTKKSKDSSKVEVLEENVS